MEQQALNRQTTEGGPIPVSASRLLGAALPDAAPSSPKPNPRAKPSQRRLTVNASKLLTSFRKLQGFEPAVPSRPPPPEPPPRPPTPWSLGAALADW